MKKSLPKSGRRISSSALTTLTNTRSAPSTANGPLDADLLRKMDAWWRAANYLSVGQTYLYDNPLLKKPLKKEHVKPRLVGHWGTTPGLNFIYVHLNRVIKERDLNMIYIIGPGHGGPGIVANTWLEGTYSEVYPNISQDEEGMKKLFKQFSFPGGIPSHVAPETPGSIHEGGELGYALSHAYGAAFDNPDLIVAAVVGDGEAETGPLATSWHSNKFLNPGHGRRGAADPAPQRLQDCQPLRARAHQPRGTGSTFPRLRLHADLRRRQRPGEDAPADGGGARSGRRRNSAHSKRRARAGTAVVERPRWPMIILRSPKGWTCPKEIDGKRAEDSWRSHQVPMGEMHEKPGHIKILEQWMKSYKPEELFDANGRFKPELAEIAPKGERRMSANPHGNGGLLLRDLRMPDFRKYAVEVKKPGATDAEATRAMGKFLRDVMKLNMESKNFRLFSPDENNSNRWQDALEVTNRAWMAETFPYDDHLAPDGRVMEMLSEHQCQGWLEGYLLTGRHGFFSCYEAFIHIIDSMFNQHAKWLKVCNHIPWRRPIASLNYLLSSHVWRQDHNGFSHQDPGFIDHVVNKKAEVVRVYLPPDANCLLSVTDHCLRSRNYVNVVVAGKQPAPAWLTMDEAIKHCTAGVGIWEWASNDKGGEPDVVMACCGDVPTLETLAAVDLLRHHMPELKVRVINVVNLMKLQPPSEHPHGLSDHDFDTLFTKDKPIVFAFHGYPWLIHRLTYRRTNHKNLHVRGYKEEGTTTTPFDMVVLNEMDRFHLVQDVIDRLPQLGSRAAYAKQAIRNALIEHRQYINERGEDHPFVLGWKWGEKGPVARRSSTEGDNV